MVDQKNVELSCESNLPSQVKHYDVAERKKQILGIFNPIILYQSLTYSKLPINKISLHMLAKPSELN